MKRVVFVATVAVLLVALLPALLVATPAEATPTPWTVVSDTSNQVALSTDGMNYTPYTNAVATWVHPVWPSISGATWISNAYDVENPHIDSWRKFTKSFELPSQAAGTLEITADNAYEVYLNGNLVGSDGVVYGPAPAVVEWNVKGIESIETYPVTLVTGTNVLEVVVRNYSVPQAYLPTHNPTGLIYKITRSYSLSVSVDPLGSGTVTLTPPDGSYSPGTAVTLTAVPVAGYEFESWSGDLISFDNTVTITMDSDKTITAHFTPIYSLSVSVDPPGSGTVTPTPWTVVSDTSNQVALSTDGMNYTPYTNAVATWVHPVWPSISGATWISNAYDVENPHIDSWRKFTKSFELPSQVAGTLEITADNAYEVYLNGNLVGSDGVVYGPAPAVVEWNVKGIESIETYPVTLVAGTNVLEVVVRNYSQPMGVPTSNPTGLIYKISTIHSLVEATPTHTGGSYSRGSVVTLTAVPAAGYEFDSWSGDLISIDNPVTITMDSDKTITAHFTPIYSLSVSVDPPGSGTVTLTPPGGSYSPGTAVTLTAVPAAGYEFDSWSGDLTGIDNPVTITMDSDKTITAHFTPIYSLSVSVDPPGSGTVTLTPPGSSYLPGTAVTLTAVPAAGYEFDHWGSDPSGSTTPTTITMGSDMNVTAHFVKSFPPLALWLILAGGIILIGLLWLLSLLVLTET